MAAIPDRGLVAEEIVGPPGYDVGLPRRYLDAA